MAQLAVIGHGSDTGTPPDFLQIGVFPDGTTYDSTSGLFSNPAGETFTLRVAPTDTPASVIAQAQALYAQQQQAAAQTAQGMHNLAAYLGQLIPAGVNPAAQPAQGTAVAPQPQQGV